MATEVSMKIRELREVEIVSDIVCDVCLESARVDEIGRASCRERVS